MPNALGSAFKVQRNMRSDRYSVTIEVNFLLADFKHCSVIYGCFLVTMNRLIPVRSNRSTFCYSICLLLHFENILTPAKYQTYAREIYLITNAFCKEITQLLIFFPLCMQMLMRHITMRYQQVHADAFECCGQP